MRRVQAPRSHVWYRRADRKNAPKRLRGRSTVNHDHVRAPAHFRRFSTARRIFTACSPPLFVFLKIRICVKIFIWRDNDSVYLYGGGNRLSWQPWALTDRARKTFAPPFPYPFRILLNPPPLVLWAVKRTRDAQQTSPHWPFATLCSGSTAPFTCERFLNFFFIWEIIFCIVQ